MLVTGSSYCSCLNPYHEVGAKLVPQIYSYGYKSSWLLRYKYTKKRVLLVKSYRYWWVVAPVWSGLYWSPYSPDTYPTHFCLTCFWWFSTAVLLSGSRFLTPPHWSRFQVSWGNTKRWHKTLQSTDWSELPQLWCSTVSAGNQNRTPEVVYLKYTLYTLNM